MQRDRVSDLLKGYACFLVVFGHVIMGIRNAGINIPGGVGIWLEQFIWTFHVKIFMFVSGYVYHITGEWKSKGTRSRFIGHKLMNLGIPYVLFSIVYILINSCISSTNANFSALDILSIWNKPVAQYWFLYSLLLLFIIWTGLSKWLKNYQITILMGVLALIINVTKITLYDGILEMLSCVLSFGIGTCMTQRTMDWVYEKAKTPYGFFAVITHIALTSIYLAVGVKTFILTQAIAVLGIIASIVLIVNIKSIKHVEKLLLLITKYSFAIYLLHTIFTAAVRIVLLKIGMDMYWVQVLFGCAVGFAGPVCVVIVCENFGIYDYLFVPAKVLTKRK